MKILSGLIQKEFEQLIRGIEVASLLCLSSDLSANTVELILCEELWDPTGGQDIVDVNQELVVCNLAISEDEEDLSSLDTSLLIHGLNVGLEVVHSVAGCDDDSNDIISEDKR